MKLPDTGWRRREGLAQLLDGLGAAEGETRFVGGCVRDALIGHEATDIDCATRLKPEETLARVRAAGFKAVPTGIAHGTVTAVLPDGPVEVTTLRRDVATDGRHAVVAFTDEWREDAARRDFTFNALFADAGTGEVHDYFGGLEDLAARRVRFIGDPFTRIAEDHLRILRFFRFHARFGGVEADAEALAACTARANDLMALSRERIADELLKMLALPSPSATIALMIAHGILAPVVPEITDAAPLLGLEAREQATGTRPDPLRRLAALLPADAEAVEAVGARLRLSNRARKRLIAAAGRNEPIGEPRALAYRFGNEGAADRILLADGVDDPAAALARIDGWERPPLPVSGGELIAMGLKPGPKVAATLQAVERAWIAEGFPPPSRAKEIAQAAVATELVKSPPSP